MEGASALALWSDGDRCSGVVTDRGALAAAATVLATGGAAALWERTTNPWGAIGAGAVLAHAAGAELADLEFCQFHPTALALPGKPARRSPDDRGGPRRGGDAARRRGRALHRRAGAARPGHGGDPRPDGRRRTDCVLLDMRAIDPARFPNVVAMLRDAGLDPTADPVPVAPAAHYLMGGVVTDLDGRSTLPGLYAVGECACTGLHGANRLASNSLSECFVFGARAAEAAVAEPVIDATASAGRGGFRFAPPTVETRHAVWADAGTAPRRRRPRAPARGPVSARAPDRGERADAPRVARRAPAQRPPAPDPGFDGIHVICGTRARAAHRTLDLAQERLMQP